jgi:uncharacterized protein (TIGR02266 family)
MGSHHRSHESPVDERRVHPRYDAHTISVGYASTDAFLFIHPDNISQMGIFIPTRQTLEAGTPLRLRFEVGDGETLDLSGRVAWASDPEEPGYGMGVEFVEVTAEQQERLKALVGQVASLPRQIN